MERKTLPLPPTNSERLEKALQVLNALGCEYVVRWNKTTYKREIQDCINEIH